MHLTAGVDEGLGDAAAEVGKLIVGNSCACFAYKYNQVL